MVSSQTEARLPWVWGSPGSVRVPAGCEHLDAPGVRVAIRAVEADAGPGVLFLWLCQLRRAPYSYDWIDNFGRRSPRIPDPSMQKLETGQPVMTIFTLTTYEAGRSLTLRMKPGWPSRVFGEINVHYDIEHVTASRSRLRASLWIPPLRGPLGELRRYLLAWGDLFMMRKQLRVLSALAERWSHLQDVQTSTTNDRP